MNGREFRSVLVGVLFGALALGGVVAVFAQGGVSGLDIVNAATGYRVAGLATLGRYLRGNGTNMVLSSVAAAGAGVCTNQFVRATVDNAVPTCAAVDDASLASNYSGVGSCTNQFPRALNDNAAPTCASVDLSADTAATVLPTTKGGTGANNTATTGRYLRGDGLNFVTSSVAAAGAGSCTNQFVRATVDNAAPTCATVNLTLDITGILPGANGGTNSAFFQVSGPTALRTYTFPDASVTIPRIITGTATATAAAVTANQCADDATTIAVTGAATGDSCSLGPPSTGPGTHISALCYVSAADVATIRFCNVSTSSQTPTSGTYRATVVK